MYMKPTRRPFCPAAAQMLRQAELVSQADFLSSVLPTQEGAETSNGRYHTMLPTTKSPERRGSSEMDANAKSRRETSYGRRSRVGRGTGAPGSASVVSAADSEAVARWASLRRLQDQGSGLATATERQLKRALELSRDLRGLKVNQWICMKLFLRGRACGKYVTAGNSRLDSTCSSVTHISIALEAMFYVSGVGQIPASTSLYIVISQFT